jgi:hypothetical protein
MAKFLSVYESSTSQYVSIKMDDVCFVGIISDNLGIQFQLSNGKLVKCALNVAEEKGAKSIREYMQARMIELFRSTPTSIVLTLPKKLPFTLSAGEEETVQAEFTAITFA